MIICAALLVQVEELDHTTIIPCRRHGDGYAIIKDLGYLPKQGYEVLADGFIDHRGTFLNRTEAWEHAVECGQLSDNSQLIANNGVLFSEDLY